MFDRLRQLRDACFARPSFRRRVAALPIGGRISESHARRLFGIVSGFAHSQMLAAGIEARVFDCLRDGPTEAGMLARRIDLPERGFATLIQALVAMGLVERRATRFALTIDGLVIATDLGIRAMVAHNALLYRDLADPLAMLRAPGSGELAAFWPYARSGGDPGGYSALMAASQGFVAEAIIAAVDFERFGHVMDIGGGDGTFLTALAARATRPRLTLIDLPPVVAIAREKLAAQRLGSRIEACVRGAGLPQADAITLVRVLHDRDDDDALALLREAAAALAPGGRVIIAEPMARTGRDAQSVYFAAYFAAMGSGRLRTNAQIKRLLNEAGLALVKTTRSLLVDVMQTRQMCA